MTAVAGGGHLPHAQTAGAGGWPGFAQRSTAPERMDVEPLDSDTIRAVLADLAQVNRVTGAAAPTLAFLRHATRHLPAGAELRVAELGYGRGDMLRRIHRWAEARGFRPRLTGVDLNPLCRAIARELTPADMAIDWHQGDLFDWQPAEPPHLVVSALFAHHLSDAAVVRLLRWQAETAAIGWFVNDLHRHWAAWAGFRALAWAARWHPIVRHDGALSVRRAFVPEDWRRLLAEAGVSGATIAWRPLFRLCVGWIRPGAGVG